MSDKHEVHQLVIRNMAVLEQAPAIVEEAEKRIFGAIDRQIEAWASIQGACTLNLMPNSSVLAPRRGDR